MSVCVWECVLHHSRAVSQLKTTYKKNINKGTVQSHLHECFCLNNTASSQSYKINTSEIKHTSVRKWKKKLRAEQQQMDRSRKKGQEQTQSYRRDNREGAAQISTAAAEWNIWDFSFLFCFPLKSLFIYFFFFKFNIRDDSFDPDAAGDVICPRQELNLLGFLMGGRLQREGRRWRCVSGTVSQLDTLSSVM